MTHVILRLPVVMKRVRLQRSPIYKNVAKGSFPSPIHLSVRAVGWIEAEVNEWISQQIAQR